MTEPRFTAQSLMTTLGDTGLRAYGGYVSEEFLPELAGNRGLKTYRRMAANDETIAAILRACESMIQGVEWTWTAVDSTPEAEKAKEFAEEIIEDMDTPLSDVIAEACTMFTYGFAPLEVTYKLRNGKGSRFTDGRFGLKDISLRAQTSLVRWEMDPKTGALHGMHQLSTWNGMAFIPREKLALFRTTSNKNNPEGMSFLRGAYRSWYFKAKIQEIEAVGIERNNAGLPLIKIPGRYLDPSASPEEKAFASAMAALGSRIRKDQQDSIIVASDRDATGTPLLEISLLTTGGKTFSATEVIQRYDRAMARSVLMDFLFLGEGSVGSFALSADKTALFAQALGAYLKRIADTFNKDVMDVLWQANGLDPKMKPKLTPGDLENRNANEIVGALAQMAAAGATVFPDRELENHMRKLLGVPQAPEDDGTALPDQGAPGMEDPEQDWILPNGRQI
jgi:hypothetical protein